MNIESVRQFGDPFGSTLMSHMEVDWNCLSQILAFSLESVIRIPFSLSDVISNASF